jgi:outer membrane protein
MISRFVDTLNFMKRVFYFSIIFLIFAQVTPGYAKDIRVGVIDIQAAVTNTNEWKKEFAKFKTRFKKEKEKISKKENNLKRMIENLNKQSMILSPEKKKKKEEALIKQKKDFERHVQDKNEEFAKKEKVITSKILKKMVKIVKNLGESKKFTMILEKKVGIYFDPSVDLTSLATKTYNSKK